MLRYEKITKDNIKYAVEIQMKIFPGECAYLEYLDVINKHLQWQNYYLVYDNDNVIGVTGLYCSEDINETNSIWLGWFGVLEEYRQKGYAKKMLLDTIEMAKEYSLEYPIKYFRIYTSTRDNPTVQILYKDIMDIEEVYNNKDDYTYDNTCVIYSKSLTDENVPYWNNRFLNIKGYIEKEENSLDELKRLYE